MNTRPAVLDVIDKFVEEYPEAEWSFAHIVLSDYGLSDSNIRFCLDFNRMRDWLRDKQKELGTARCCEVGFATMIFLVGLLEIPEAIREDAMETYQGVEIIE